jgi:hypothetical protein
MTDKRAVVALALLAVVVLACGRPRATAHPEPTLTPGPTTAAAGATQLLAISTVPRLIPAPTAQDRLDAANLVRRAGAQATFESATWSSVDTPAGYDQLQQSLRGADTFGYQTLLNLKVIDTTALAVPARLAHQSLDSAATESAFHALIDRLRPSLHSVRYLAIGNEVDVYLSAHPSAWDSYLRFYTDAVAYVHATVPDVLVGVTSTFDGARLGTAAQVAALNRVSDVEILTYYPLGPHFSPRPPSTAAGDIAQMLTIAGPNPLVLQEVGYPSDPRLASSEPAQAAFVTNVMAAWRQAGARIPMLNWFALHDFTADICDQFSVYYLQPHDTNFRAYLCSLGLRHADGTAKPAWTALQNRPR